jgi:simple sugar transport system permease protein
MMLWRGVLLYITGGFPVSYEADKTLLYFLGGRVFEGLRATGIWFVILTILFIVILGRTRYGNWVLATGGNRDSARTSGVDIDRVKLINFTLCSLLAGFSGTANLARYLISQPMLGSEMGLEAIAASVIGGNLLTGGYGSILGTFLGALLMGIIRTGLISVGVEPYLYMTFTGLILITAVIINMTVISRRVR